MIWNLKYQSVSPETNETMGLLLIITLKGSNLNAESRFPFSANMNLVWNFPIVHALKFGYGEVFGP